MSGQPVLNKLCRYVEAKGGDEWLLDQIAAGASAGAVAKTITLPGHGSISRPLLYKWRNAGGPERREAWDTAMNARGEQLVEEAGDILDDLTGELPTSAEVSLAKARSEHRRWLGAKLNNKYADKPTEVNVAVAIGAEAQLHAALAKHGQRRALPTPRQEIPDAEYEVIE